MTRAELERWLSKQGFSRAADLARIAEPCWIGRRGDGASRSRIGGAPDLAQGQSWPTNAEGRPLSLLAQIDLAGVGAPFPSAGLLAWYLDVERSAGPPATAMTFVTEPTTPSARPDATTRVRLYPEWSFPPTGSAAIFPAHFGLDALAERELMDLSGLWATELRDRHGWDASLQLGGYADAENDPYVGVALDADAALHARYFAMPVRERAGSPPPDVMSAALAFRHCVTLEAIPGVDFFGDGASLRFLVHHDAWTSEGFVVDPVTKQVAARSW